MIVYYRIPVTQEAHGITGTRHLVKREVVPHSQLSTVTRAMGYSTEQGARYDLVLVDDSTAPATILRADFPLEEILQNGLSFPDLFINMRGDIWNHKECVMRGLRV